MILLPFYKKNDINLLFHLTQIAAILDFINYATCHTKIKNLQIFCQKYFHFIVSSCTHGGHLGFCYFSVSEVENDFGLLG